MSTDGSDQQPRTRAELRAAREAAERAAAAARESAAEVAPAPIPESSAPAAEPPTSQVPPIPRPEQPQPGIDLPPEAAVDAPYRRSVNPEASAPVEHVQELIDASPVSAADAAEQVEERTEDDELVPEHAVPLEGPVAEAPPAGPTRHDGGPGRRPRFGVAFIAVLAVLLLVGGGLAITSMLQGPRLSDVQVSPAQAVKHSGGRVILLTNQPLAEVDPKQVTVEPAVGFTVESSGRNVGVRFTVPLDADTKYSIRVAGVRSTGGGPASDLTTTFQTPPSEVYLLRRDPSGEDSVFLTDLSGKKAVPVYSAERINDFRAVNGSLVVAIEDGETSRLLVMDDDGTNQRELKKPGDGIVTSVQVSDRGGLVGYSYADKELSETSGRASVLVTQRMDGSDEPTIVSAGDKELQVSEWEFVPDTSSVLFIDFSGALSLVDPRGGNEIKTLGIAGRIQGVTRGTYTALVTRSNGATVELDLATGKEQKVPAAKPDYGTADTIVPYPNGTLRKMVAFSDKGIPQAQRVVTVNSEGTATLLMEVPSGSSIVQTCVSPSGQYAAVVIAPNLADNRYDDHRLPLPTNLETHLIEMDSAEQLVALTGFDISWCRMAPPL